MSVAKELDEFFRESRQEVFIEAEGKPKVIINFINDYNARFGHSIDEEEDGIIVLQEDADKWGLELRMYFNDKSGVPDSIHVTNTRGYRGNYSCRINDSDLIDKMFSLGYCIGKN